MNKKSVLLVLWQKFTSHFCKSEKKDELMAYMSESSTSPMETKESKRRDTLCKTKNLTENVESFLKSHYDFRYNVLTEETEFRSLERMNEGFQSVINVY